jgi:hypothetical protein
VSDSVSGIEQAGVGWRAGRVDTGDAHEWERAVGVHGGRAEDGHANKGAGIPRFELGVREAVACMAGTDYQTFETR